MLAAEGRLDALLGDVGEHRPLAAVVLRADEDLPLAAVAALHLVHHPPAVGRGGQEVLGDPVVGEDAGQLDRRGSRCRGRGRRRPGRTPGPPPGTVPGTGCRVHQKPLESAFHASDPPAVPVLTRSSGSPTCLPVSTSWTKTVPRSVPSFDSDTATLRPVGGGHEEVDGRPAAGVERVGVDEHLLVGEVVEVGQRDQERLLQRRLPLEQEVRRPAALHLVVRRRVDGEDLLRTAPGWPPAPGPRRGTPGSRRPAPPSTPSSPRSRSPPASGSPPTPPPRGRCRSPSPCASPPSRDLTPGAACARNRRDGRSVRKESAETGECAQEQASRRSVRTGAHFSRLGLR